MMLFHVEIKMNEIKKVANLCKKPRNNKIARVNI